MIKSKIKTHKYKRKKLYFYFLYEKITLFLYFYQRYLENSARYRLFVKDTYFLIDELCPESFLYFVA